MSGSAESSSEPTSLSLPTYTPLPKTEFLTSFRSMRAVNTFGRASAKKNAVLYRRYAKRTSITRLEGYHTKSIGASAHPGSRKTVVGKDSFLIEK